VLAFFPHRARRRHGRSSLLAQRWPWSWPAKRVVQQPIAPAASGWSTATMLTVAGAIVAAVAVLRREGVGPSRARWAGRAQVVWPPARRQIDRRRGRRIHAVCTPAPRCTDRCLDPDAAGNLQAPFLWNTFSASIWMTGQFLVYYCMIAMFASWRCGSRPRCRRSSAPCR
jgi:hypothetical protein